MGLPQLSENFFSNKIQDYFINISDPAPRMYDVEYSESFPIANYYISKYKVVPSHIQTDDYYQVSVCDALAKNGYLIHWVSKSVFNNTQYPTSILYAKPSLDGYPWPKNTYVILNFKKDIHHNIVHNSNYNDFNHIFLEEEEVPDNIPYKSKISVYYTNEKEASEILDIIKDHIVPENTNPKISLLTSTSRGLSTVVQDINPIENMDIALNYGESFVKIHDKILSKLNEDRGKGLVLLHGLPGTGKTSYIKYLCSLLKKEVIFLPPYLAENISNPDFIPFLLDHTNSILVIEDAEKVVLERESYESNKQGVSNILNMTDGILSDCLSIQIIATFNTSRDRIDKALLRKGRLIAEHKFDLLSVDSANKLLKFLKKDYIADKPMSLTEIYNIEEELNVSQEERRTIGFNNYQ
jgi:hypothetical protein